MKIIQPLTSTSQAQGADVFLRASWLLWRGPAVCACIGDGCRCISFSETQCMCEYMYVYVRVSMLHASSKDAFIVPTCSNAMQLNGWFL